MEKIIELPELNSCQDAAINAVVSVLNKAQTKMGIRQNLFQLAQSRDVFGKTMLNLTKLGTPLAIKSEKLISEAIDRKWRLTENFMYVMKYIGTSEDESAQYHYYEMVFTIEGHRTEHDVRYTKLTMDWLLAVMQMKLLVFKRVEMLKYF